MRFLIIEDDTNKARELCLYLSEQFPAAELSQAASFNSGVRQLRQSTYDFVLLDMTMPTFDRTAKESGGRVRAFAGREILREIERRRILASVIIVTAFESFGDAASRVTLEQLRGDLQVEFPSSLFGMIYYDPSNDSWRGALRDLISQAEDIA